MYSGAGWWGTVQTCPQGKLVRSFTKRVSPNKAKGVLFTNPTCSVMSNIVKNRGPLISHSHLPKNQFIERNVLMLKYFFFGGRGWGGGGQYITVKLCCQQTWIHYSASFLSIKSQRSFFHSLHYSCGNVICKFNLVLILK